MLDDPEEPMNLFVLNESPSRSAIDMRDQHINKMILETAQIIDGGTRPIMAQLEPSKAPHEIVKIPYTHRDNPVIHSASDPAVRWWALQHLDALLLEFRYRYGHQHKYATNGVRDRLHRRCKRVEGLGNAKGFRLALPAQYGGQGYVKSAALAVPKYRAYYAAEKHVYGTKTVKPSTWLLRSPPRWMQVTLSGRGYRQALTQDGRYSFFERVEDGPE